MKRSAYQLIKKPIISEKSVKAQEMGKYIFEVEKDANKIEIKKAIEEIFKVKVKKVNVINVPGKRRMFRGVRGKTREWKKVMVTLISGHKIEIFEGT